jgi:hypothetical protein
MLIMSGEKDHTVPRSIADAIYAKQKRNAGVTEFVEMPGRGRRVRSSWRPPTDADPCRRTTPSAHLVKNRLAARHPGASRRGVADTDAGGRRHDNV